MTKYEFTNEPDYYDIRYLWDKGEWPEREVPDWAEEAAAHLQTDSVASSAVLLMGFERIVERQQDEMHLAVQHSNGLLKKVSELSAELEAAKAEAERVQQLPSLDWAQACTAFTQQLAALARNGEQPAAKRAMKRGDDMAAWADEFYADDHVALVARALAVEEQTARAYVERTHGDFVASLDDPRALDAWEQMRHSALMEVADGA